MTPLRAKSWWLYVHMNHQFCMFQSKNTRLMLYALVHRSTLDRIIAWWRQHGCFSFHAIWILPIFSWIYPHVLRIAQQAISVLWSFGLLVAILLYCRSLLGWIVGWLITNCQENVIRLLARVLVLLLVVVGCGWLLLRVVIVIINQEEWEETNRWAHCAFHLEMMWSRDEIRPNNKGKYWLQS